MAPRSPRRRGIALALGLTFVLAACSSSSTASPVITAAPTASPAASTPASEAPGPSGSAALPAPERTDLKIGNSGPFQVSNPVALIASYDELYKKYGFASIEWLEFGGGSQAVQANIAGQVDLSDNSGGPVVASLLTDAPLVMTYIVNSALTDCIAVKPGIETADDLRGQSVAISSFGSVSHAGALVGLSALGLTSNDVTITQIGNGSARLAALQSGSVAAAILDITEIAAIADLGFHCLINLADIETAGGVARTSLTFTQEFVSKYPNTVLDLTAMYAEANVLWRADANHTAEALSSLAQISMDDALDQVNATIAQPWRPLDGRCDPKVMEFTKETLLPTDPDLADVDPTQACTNDFLDQLTTIGFMSEVGVPGY
jgi:ABC-type nitrate/sulfonate/bicarbonate transport system substrate-binding protein